MYWVLTFVLTEIRCPHRHCRRSLSIFLIGWLVHCICHKNYLLATARLTPSRRSVIMNAIAREFLLENARFAVVGASSNRSKVGNQVLRWYPIFTFLHSRPIRCFNSSLCHEISRYQARNLPVTPINPVGLSPWLLSCRSFIDLFYCVVLCVVL